MLKRGQWSVEELTRLREGYGRRPLGQLVRELRRTPETIRQRARQLFGGRTRVGALTASERRELRRMVGVADLPTMALVLGRAEAEVFEVLHGWSERRRKGRFEAWETDYMKEHFASRPDWALALVLGRSPAVIRRRARDLCLGKDRRLESVPIPGLEKVVELTPQPPIRMPRWTVEEVQTLCRVYPHHPNLEVARVLGRSAKSVIAKANQLGLKKTAERLEQMGRDNVRRRYDS